MLPVPRLEGQRVLVTGAAGFIGANLVRALVEARSEVHALIRPTSDLWRLRDVLPCLSGLHSVDMRCREDLLTTVRGVSPAVIFHGAAPPGHPSGVTHEASFIRDTVVSTVHVLEAAADSNVSRVIHLGSSLEYGPRRKALSETDRLDPTTTRGVAKAAATLLCRQWARSHRTLVVVLRLFSVYGPWEGATRLVPTAILAALDGCPLALTPPGFRHDFIFVEDVVEACARAVGVSLSPGTILNIGSGRQWTNEAVIRILQTVSGIPICVRPGSHPPRPLDTHHWVAEISRARRQLGWKPRYTLARGLQKTMEWFRAHRSVYPRPEAMSPQGGR